MPAEVIVGNTLSWDIREVLYTPAHHLGLWKYRLHRKKDSTEVAPAPKDQTAEPVAAVPAPKESKPAPVTTPTQLGFDF